MEFIVNVIHHAAGFAGSLLSSEVIYKLSVSMLVFVGCQAVEGAFTLYAPYDYLTFHTSLDGGASAAVAQGVVSLCANNTAVFGVEHLRDGAVAVAQSCNLSVFSITPAA